jgi:hypothetical protein
MRKNLPFIWRKYYLNEANPSEKMQLETAHEQARQYLSRAVAPRVSRVRDSIV